MPTYEYECEQCKRTFEVRQRISEPPLTVCEQCGGAVRRLLAATAFILKGDGWYVTDYPSEARKKGKEAETATASATSTASSSGDGKSSTGSSATSASSASSSAGAGGSTGAPSTSSSSSKSD